MLPCCCAAVAWVATRRIRVGKSSLIFPLILPPIYPTHLLFVDGWKNIRGVLNMLPLDLVSWQLHQAHRAQHQSEKQTDQFLGSGIRTSCVPFEEGWWSESFRRRNLWGFPETTGGLAIVQPRFLCPPVPPTTVNKKILSIYSLEKASPGSFEEWFSLLRWSVQKVHIGALCLRSD